MYFSSSSVSKRLVLLPPSHVGPPLVVTIKLLLIGSISSLNITNEYLHHKCIENQGKYQLGSNYEKNLNKIIRSASTKDFRSGFEQIYLGKGPDTVSFTYQCRGDSYGPKCRSCYNIALSALRKRCPRNKGRIIWFDQCLMEISSLISDGKIDYNNNFCMSNTKNASGDMPAFKQKLNSFLLKLGSKAIDIEYIAAGGTKAVMFASREERVGTKKLYAMVQCSKDLWLKTCYACLEWIILKESDCCEGKLGGRVFSTSCNYRYELYPFIKTIDS